MNVPNGFYMHVHICQICTIPIMGNLSLSLSLYARSYSQFFSELYLFQEVEKPEMGFANHKYSYGHDECP